MRADRLAAGRAGRRTITFGDLTSLDEAELDELRRRLGAQAGDADATVQAPDGATLTVVDEDTGDAMWVAQLSYLLGPPNLQ